MEECYFSIANVSLEGRNVYFDTFLTKPMIKKWQQEPEAGWDFTAPLEFIADILASDGRIPPHEVAELLEVYLLAVE